jgi:hypothetical protein
MRFDLDSAAKVLDEICREMGAQGFHAPAQIILV